MGIKAQESIDVHCAGLFLFNDSGELAFVRKKNHGHVSFPKGKIMDDESPLDCAIFKARDEVGVHQDELQILLPYAVADYCRHSEHGIKHLTLYIAHTTVRELHPECDKYEAWWAGRKQVEELAHREDQKAAKKAFALYRKGKLPVFI